MSKPAIIVTVKGIKCDACPYRDDSVEFRNYQEYLNKPCPDCGASLLTPEDFAAIKVVLGLSDWANTLIGPVDDDAEQGLKGKLVFDGSGVPELKIEGEDD